MSGPCKGKGKGQGGQGTRARDKGQEAKGKGQGQGQGARGKGKGKSKGQGQGTKGQEARLNQKHQTNAHAQRASHRRRKVGPGYWVGPEAVKYHCGNNYIYVGPAAASWLWSQKPEPAVPSDLDSTGEFGESQLGWDGYAAKHEVLYCPYRTSSLFSDYDEAWKHFTNLPPALHIDVIRRLAHTQAKAMTVKDWNDERRQNALMGIAKETRPSLAPEGAKEGLRAGKPHCLYCSPIMDGASGLLILRGS